MAMGFELYVSRESENVVAFKYGGILLAGDLDMDRVRPIVSADRDPAEFITRTSEEELIFEIDGYLMPGNRSITLKPLYEFETEARMAYWNLYTPEQYENMPKEDTTLEDQLYEVTVDRVTPGHQQSELDHNYQYQGSVSNGMYSPAAQDGATGSWRDVRNGWFSYDLKVDPKKINYVLSVFWGSDSGSDRVFNIYVNDELMKEGYTLNNNRPDKVEFYYIELPLEMTYGKETITVKYQSEKQAGGIFGVRTTTKPVTEESDKVLYAEDQPVLLSEISVEPPTKTEYEVGEELDTTGMIISALYTDGSEKELDLTECEITGFDSTSAGDMTVKITYEDCVTGFKVKVKEKADEPTPTPTPSEWKFVDVKTDGSDWFYESVKYVFEEGIMTGKQETIFAPFDNISRAEFAIVLWRMENSPEPTIVETYDDVNGDEFFAKAVTWAKEAGVITGYAGGKNFGPYDMITREQIATIMFRYANAEKTDGDLSAFGDAASVSEFALDGMKWAVANGVISGKGPEGAKTLSHQDNTTRCEAAAIIQRFMK